MPPVRKAPITFMFIPGWALCSEALWAPTLEPLAAQFRADLFPSRLSVCPTPFFTPQDLWNDTGVSSLVLVGHSLGGLYAAGCLKEHAALRRKTAALMMINSRLDFLQGPWRPHGISPRILSRMIAKIQTAPLDVVEDFFSALNLSPSLKAVLYPLSERESPSQTQEVLTKGLEALGQIRLKSPPILETFFLNSADDPLFAPPHTAGSRQNILPGGGHLLPLTCGPTVAKWIYTSFQSIRSQKRRD